MKILIVEDDKNILSLLERGFVEGGNIVDKATDGEDGEYLAKIMQYDVIILDWMLPKKSGIEVLKSLRESNITTAILILTAKGEIHNKVDGFNNGCDDYLSKPFNFEELQARVYALYRRSLFSSSNIIVLQNIVIDISKKIVMMDKQKIDLTLKEYQLLLYLVQNKNSFVSKMMIEDMLWNNEKFVSSNVVQVTIYNLRKKIGKEYIKSFRGLGYKIEI